MCSVMENEKKLEERLKRMDEVEKEALVNLFDREEKYCIANRLSIFKETDEKIIYVTKGMLGQCIKCPSYNYMVWVSYCEVMKNEK